MILQKLSLLNFKNFSETVLSFSDSINCISGNNGSGKTNILDAIHYLALCKSYFQATDSLHIKQGCNLFVIQGDFMINKQPESVFCGLKINQKKIIKRNQKEYDKLSDHIGLLPVVMIAPVDQEIITGGSDERRKFMDSIISQTDRSYLLNLIQYNRVLAQRNALLKQMAIQKVYDYAHLEIWDEQLVPLGEQLVEKRKLFCADFIVLFKKIYKTLGGITEQIEMVYESDLLEAPFAVSLKNSLRKDTAMQFTTVGVHKDELSFFINEMSAKKFASQGQQKTFVVSLKLAQYEMMYSLKNTKPILMLDDIFDKLDESRVSRLLALVSGEQYGQLFITDTHPERIAGIFERINVPVRKFVIDNGVVLQEVES